MSFLVLILAIVGYLVLCIYEAYSAKKANFDCSKCKNFNCTARFCEQKRSKK